jgi:hypothetical protein
MQKVNKTIIHNKHRFNRFEKKIVRGQQKIFKPFICEDPNPIKKGRGRSGTLINNRDRKLVLRYYYHTSICKTKYEETINNLVNEFDLAERTITDRLLLNNDTINELMKLHPNKNTLKKEVPYFSW